LSWKTWFDIDKKSLFLPLWRFLNPAVMQADKIEKDVAKLLKKREWRR